MNVKYICNAFSLQMIKDSNYTVKVKEIEKKNVKKIIADNKGKSAIGHIDTANVLGVPYNRINISLEKGDKILVAQLQGGRLPEGSITLPEGFKFKYLLVKIE